MREEQSRDNESRLYKVKQEEWTVENRTLSCGGYMWVRRGILTVIRVPSVLYLMLHALPYFIYIQEESIHFPERQIYQIVFAPFSQKGPSRKAMNWGQILSF